MTLLLTHWRIAAFAVLLGFASLQTYRLQGAHGEIALYKLKDQARAEAAAKQALHELKNKDRTDDQYKADQRAARLAALRVRPVTFVGGVKPPAEAPARSRDESPSCFDTRQLDQELGRWAERVAERFSRSAQQAEEVAAAYRACRAFVLNQE